MDEKSRKEIIEAFSIYPKVFLSQEKIYAYYNKIYFTGFRLLSTNDFGKIQNEIPIENVLGFKANTRNSLKLGSLLVEKKDGTSVNFGNIIDKEYQEFQRVLTKIHSGELPEYIEAPTREENSQVARDQTVAPVAPPYHGTVVASEGFGNYKVVIFSGGFVQISKFIGLAKGSVEKLLQIEAESQISKKTGLGRGLATIATVGFNQNLPNQRGNLILTITTDKKVHVLFQDMPYNHDIKSMQKLEAAGKSVINQGAKSTSTDDHKVAPDSQSLAQQIRELSELKDAGIISQQEFESAKQKLLS